MMAVADPQSILSAMITPAVLISACGSIIIATVGRLNRAVDRTREVFGTFAALAEKVGQAAEVTSDDDSEMALLFSQLDINTTRARLLQRALARVYWSLGLFVATSVAIGLVAVTGGRYTWAPISLGIAGAALLLYGSLLLVHESRLALRVLDLEMDFLWSRSQRRAPPELLEKYRPAWTLFRRRNPDL
jgi:hypothetical protein